MVGNVLKRVACLLTERVPFFAKVAFACPTSYLDRKANPFDTGNIHYPANHISSSEDTERNDSAQ